MDQVNTRLIKLNRIVGPRRELVSRINIGNSSKGGGKAGKFQLVIW